MNPWTLAGTIAGWGVVVALVLTFVLVVFLVVFAIVKTLRERGDASPDSTVILSGGGENDHDV